MAPQERFNTLEIKFWWIVVGQKGARRAGDAPYFRRKTAFSADLVDVKFFKKLGEVGA